MKPVIIENEVQADIDFALSKSSKRKCFELAINSVLETISMYPEIVPIAFGTVRRFIMSNRYPFSIYYREETDHIKVVAFAHNSFNPGKWI